MENAAKVCPKGRSQAEKIGRLKYNQQLLKNVLSETKEVESARAESPVQSPQEIRDIVAYGPLQFSVQTNDEDKDLESERFGLPTYYTLARTGVNQARVHFSRVIHFATRLLTHPYKGISVLTRVYDDLTVLRNVRWGMN